ncbi:MAG: nucleotidyltransferase domain-containing protein [Ignavibacteria bacterium]|nr:nucleotidyltransferase domain-containing protein [Ignavibacteria bacterium]
MYQEIKNKIVELLGGLEYDKILLFGSRARGENRSDSDYDVIVVLKDNLERNEILKIESIISKSFAQELIDIDIIVKTSEQYDYLKDKIGNVIYYADEYGVAL